MGCLFEAIAEVVAKLLEGGVVGVEGIVNIERALAVTDQETDWGQGRDGQLRIEEEDGAGGVDQAAAEEALNREIVFDGALGEGVPKLIKGQAERAFVEEVGGDGGKRFVEDQFFESWVAAEEVTATERRQGKGRYKVFKNNEMVFFKEVSLGGRNHPAHKKGFFLNLIVL